MPDDSHYTFSVNPARGFHATLSSQIQTSTIPKNCSLCVALSLPASCFVDPHELALYDAFSFTIDNSPDLEQPAHSVSSDRLSLFIHAHVPPASLIDSSFSLDVPIHVRYPAPGRPALHSDVTVAIPWPEVYWTCNDSWERRRIDGLTTHQNGCHESDALRVLSIKPHTEENIVTIAVPSLRTDYTREVESLTALVVMVGYVYVVLLACRSVQRLRVGS